MLDERVLLLEDFFAAGVRAMPVLTLGRDAHHGARFGGTVLSRHKADVLGDEVPLVWCVARSGIAGDRGMARMTID
jgi:hypothetical protein